MYLCALKIIIMSKEKSEAEAIAGLICDTQPPEDCTYHIETADFSESFEIKSDCAVVIDRDLNRLKSYRRQGAERVVFLASAGEIAQLDDSLLASADDLWVFPDREIGAKMLKVYFSKLLNTLKDSFDSRRQDICFHTIIDSLPDLVWFKDNDGAHLIVNDTFCGVVKKTKQQIYKKHHNYIWGLPEDDYEHGEGICRKSEEVVERERKTCQFEEQVTTNDGTRQLATYKSPLIDVDGSIFGTCGMGHDTTDLQNVSKELVFVLDCIPFGVAIVDNDDKVLSVNRFLRKYFPGANEINGKPFSDWINKLPKEKLGANDSEEEYRVFLGKREHILRFREEPIVDIFGGNLGKLHFIRDVTLQYNYDQQNIKHANTDFLTGLNNRRSLFDHLTGLPENSRITIIMVDLDRFKSVNDTYGHAAGDEALMITSRTLEECFTDGFIARLGGDEFLVALVGEYELPQIEERTQNFLDTLLKKYSEKEEFHALSSSAGIAQERLAVCEIGSIENLIKRSDDALYNAKESGKARYCVNQ